MGVLYVWRWSGRVGGASVVALLTGLMATPVTAGQWDITPRLSFEETFTDNVNGADNDENPESDLISTATAGIALNGTGGRIRVVADYGFSVDRHLNSNENDGFRHDLLGTARFEPWKEHLFLDLRSAVSQSIIDQSGEVSADDRLTSSNQTITANTSLSASFLHGNDGWADSGLTYRLTETRFFDTGVDGTNGTNGTSSDAPESTRTFEMLSTLASGRRFSTFQWDGSSRTTFQFEGGELRSRRDTLEASAQYRRWRMFAPQVSAGIERFKDSELEDDENTGGIFWTIGATVQPSPRTSLELNYGSRFDSNDFTGSLSHQFSPRTSISASYSVDVTTQQQALLDSLQNVVVDENGQLVDATTGLPANPNNLNSSLVDDSFRSETFELGLSGSRGRSSFSVSANMTRRLFGDADGDQGKDLSGSLSMSFSRRLSPILSASVNGTASFENPSGIDNNTQTYRAGANVSYQLGPTVSTSLRYDYLRQDSFDETVTENAVSLRVTKEF